MSRGHVPERSCVGCGQKTAKRELVRVVRTPQGHVEADPSGKKPGRGAYLCYNIACWERALKGDRLARALKTAISPEDREGLMTFARQAVKPVAEEVP